MRKPVKPETVLAVFNAVLCVVRWMLIPIVLLPLAASIAAFGWKGFRSQWWMQAKKKIYWIEVPVLLVCAFWLPLKLIGWVPHVPNFTMETISFVLRLAIAYLLFTAAWITLARFTSGGNPVLSQPSTLASP
jgi:hypothetical protein